MSERCVCCGRDIPEGRQVCPICEGMGKRQDDSIGDIIPIETNLPHRVSEVICLKCLKRWICVRPATTLLKQLECPCCGMTSFVIETGEQLEQEDER